MLGANKRRKWLPENLLSLEDELSKKHLWTTNMSSNEIQKRDSNVTCTALQYIQQLLGGPKCRDHHLRLGFSICLCIDRLLHGIGETFVNHLHPQRYRVGSSTLKLSTHRITHLSACQYETEYQSTWRHLPTKNHPAISKNS